MDFNNDTGTIFGGIQTIDPSVLPPLGGQEGVLTILGNGALAVPVGSTLQRPVSPSAAMLRYNTDTTTLEYYNGALWAMLSVGGGTVTSVAASGSTGLTVGGSPITSSGTLTFTLDNGLQNLATFATTGILVATGADTWDSRTIEGTSGNVDVTDGDGILANPVIDLATVSQANTGDFVKITLDTYGRVSGNTPVITADITALVDSTYVNVTGDTMSSGANLTFAGGEVLGLPMTPSSDDAAASKYYVDTVSAGLSWKQAVVASTTAPGSLSSDYEDGNTIDGVILSSGDRILIKNQVLPEENGIYIVQVTGSPIRSSDMDSTTPVNEVNGAAVFVEQGTTLANTAWVQTDQVSVIGVDPIEFAQFAGTGTYLAGNGLTLTGNTFALSAPVSIANGGTSISTTPTNGQLLIGNGTNYTLSTITAGTGVSITNGSGSITVANTGVTSVALSDLSTAPIYTISGSPVTTTGTLAITLASQTANTVFAAPNGSTGQPTFRSLVSADLSTAIQLYKENPSSPTVPTASGTNAVAIGSGASATASGSFAEGNGAVARSFGQKAFANGFTNTAGDAQYSIYVLRNVTTTTTSTELFLDGTAATQRLVLPNNSVFVFDILVAGRRTDATGGGAGYRFTGVARKDTTSASITFVGTPSKTVLGENDGAWDAVLTVDTVNGSIKVSVVGQNGKTISWVATVLTTEVTN